MEKQRVGIPKLTPQTTFGSLSTTKVEINSGVKRLQNYYGVFELTKFSQANHIPNGTEFVSWVWGSREKWVEWETETKAGNGKGDGPLCAV